MAEYQLNYTADEICRRLEMITVGVNKTQIYAYDLQDLKDRETILGTPVFSFESYYTSGSDADGEYATLQFIYRLTPAIKRGASYPVEYILDTPAILKVENETDRYPHSYWINEEGFFDWGLEIDGDMITFSEFIKDAVDGEVVLDANMYVGNGGGSTNWSQVAAGLSCQMSLRVRGEENATAIYEELSTAFEEYQTKLYMFFKYDPVEIIEAQYRGE